MDSAPDPPESRSGSPVDSSDSPEPAAKKARFCDGSDGNMKKVAEMVLVLAAMGQMRAGRSPTSAEREMMSEAREKLVQVCLEFPPKDVFPRDAFAAVIEDLGLNKLKEQRLGFRPSKMSIADKVSLTKQKMEKSQEFSLHSASYPSQKSQTNPGAAVENRGPSHAVRIFPSDKTNYVPNSSGGSQTVSPSPAGLGSVSKSTTLPYQLPTSEVRPMVSSGVPSSHVGRESSSSQAFQKVERQHYRLDGKSNGSPFTPQLQANSCGVQASGKTPTWSVQTQSTPSPKIGLENRVLTRSCVKKDGTTDVATSRLGPQVTSKPSITQTTSGNTSSTQPPFQAISLTQAAPVSNNHNEIGRIVQKFLQPQVPRQLSWTPPSRDYMNKAITCTTCKAIINDVDCLLICDACEKGFHLKCLQPPNQKGIPRADWHCHNCLEISNGKPLPPKYGRVMRNINTTKVSSNASAEPLSSEKKVGVTGYAGEKGDHSKAPANGNSSLQSAPNGPVASNSRPTSELNMANTNEVQHSESLSNDVKTNTDSHLGNITDNGVRTSSSGSISAVSSCETSIPEKVVNDAKPQDPPGIIIKSDECLQRLSTPQGNGQSGLISRDEISSKNCLDNHSMVTDYKKPLNEGSLGVNAINETIGLQGNNVEAIVVAEHDVPSSDNLHDIDWIGDVFRVVDGKTYYQTCRINGVVHKVHSHVLIRYHNDKLMPSKLQALWEDIKTRSKWAAVNLCYFPDDLPEFGRPCTSESCEVYESVHQTTVLASLIQGSCEVLHSSKFMEEKQKRTHLVPQKDNRLRPLFLCKWFYDEKKRLFRDVSS